MATLNGTEFAGPGWSVPPELWPTAVTRGRNRWTRQPEDEMTLTAEQVMAAALHRIAAMRDGIAYGSMELPEEYECYDDWAADVAEKALDEAGYYHSWHTKDKVEDK